MALLQIWAEEKALYPQLERGPGPVQEGTRRRCFPQLLWAKRRGDPVCISSLSFTLPILPQE